MMHANARGQGTEGVIWHDMAQYQYCLTSPDGPLYESCYWGEAEEDEEGRETCGV